MSRVNDHAAPKSFQTHTTKSPSHGGSHRQRDHQSTYQIHTKSKPNPCQILIKHQVKSSIHIEAPQITRQGSPNPYQIRTKTSHQATNQSRIKKQTGVSCLSFRPFTHDFQPKGTLTQPNPNPPSFNFRQPPPTHIQLSPQPNPKEGARKHRVCSQTKPNPSQPNSTINSANPLLPASNPYPSPNQGKPSSPVPDEASAAERSRRR